jgi:hypothetical protein
VCALWSLHGAIVGGWVEGKRKGGATVRDCCLQGRCVYCRGFSLHLHLMTHLPPSHFLSPTAVHRAGVFGAEGAASAAAQRDTPHSLPSPFLLQMLLAGRVCLVLRVLRLLPSLPP